MVFQVDFRQFEHLNRNYPVDWQSGRPPERVTFTNRPMIWPDDGSTGIGRTSGPTTKHMISDSGIWIRLKSLRFRQFDLCKQTFLLLVSVAVRQN